MLKSFSPHYRKYVSQRRCTLSPRWVLTLKACQRFSPGFPFSHFGFLIIVSVSDDLRPSFYFCAFSLTPSGTSGISFPSVTIKEQMLASPTPCSSLLLNRNAHGHRQHT
ncbi:hypothetical protein NPIL_102681 [Nephila pilipes]|uniref:Uncharacterized protein n=1 Tax=Nephila pilipes TaxID=299642 RepID=A0A8X6J5B6_NEPPI|nr:hypothetical protein NPIL_102681 [Nephila pilipes]